MSKRFSFPVIVIAACAIVFGVGRAQGDVVSWVGPTGVQDWNQATNWSSGAVPTGDATVYFPLAPKNYYFELTPPDSFTGTILSSNYYNLAGGGYNSKLFSVILKLGVADGARWTVSGNGDLVATDGLAERLAPDFTGQIDVRKGTVFTAPNALAGNVRLVGAGRLVLGSASQLPQAAAFAGEVALPAGNATYATTVLFANHTVELSDGQTVTLDAHDILNGQTCPIPSFPDDRAAWSYNGTAWTNGTLSSGPFSTAPPHLDTDGSLLLTDDPAQVHTVFYTNRTFSAQDEWGYSFRWSPELPPDSRVVKDGRGQTLAGTLSICFQRVSATNVKTGKNRAQHGDMLYGFYLYPYNGDKNPFISWIFDGVSGGAAEGMHESQLGGISLRQPIDFTVSMIGGTMTVTMVQGEKSASVSHNFSTALSVRCCNSIWVGLGGASDEWGENHVIPWVRHRISNFSGWYWDSVGGGWRDVPGFTPFSSSNWYMIRKYAATGKEITREDDACVNADGTVTLCEQVASNMTYMVSKTPLSAPHSKRLKVSFDIQGGAAHYEGNAPPMRVGFLLGGKNAVTWNSSWTYTDFVFNDWLYGFAFNWDLTTGQGHFVASRLSADKITGDGVRTGPTMSWVSRGDNSRSNQNQKMDVDLIYDPVGRVSGIFSTRAKSASQNSQCTRVDWSVPEAYLPHLEYWKANRAPYVGIRVASGKGNYTGMRLDGMRVQRMDAAEAGRLPGTLRVPAGASATLAAGEAMAGQDTRVVTVAEVELGAAASLTVSPATNNATIVGVESVTAFGAGTLATAPGASVAVEKVSLAGTAGQSSLTVTGGVTFPAALSVTIPDAWLDSPDRLVVVDAAGAAGQFSSAVSIVTESGADVTDRAHLSVRGGIVSIGFANETVIIVR